MKEREYGISAAHHIFIRGVTYPPEKSMGTLTALFCHIWTDEKYRKKVTNAAKSAMLDIPIIDEILEIVKGNEAFEIRGIIRLLAEDIFRTTSQQ